MGLLETIEQLKSRVEMTDPAVLAKAIADTGRKDISVSADSASGKSALSVVKRGHVALGAPEGETLRALVEQAGFEWSPAFEGRAIAYWASDERVDRRGDIVRQNWNFAEYRKNPIIARAHDWEGPPIGRGIQYEVRSRSDADYAGPALHMVSLFTPATESADAESVFRLVKSGFMTSASVGFFSDKVVDITDPEERKRLGLGRFGFVLDMNRLVELSPVTVPANPGAHVIASMAAAKANGVLRAVDIEFAREIMRRNARRDSQERVVWRDADQMWVRSARAVFADHDFEDAADIDKALVPEDRTRSGAVPVSADLRNGNRDDDRAPAIAARDAADIIARVDRLEAASCELLSTVASLLRDVRESVERIAEKVGAEAPAADDGEETPPADPAGDPPAADPDDSQKPDGDVAAGDKGSGTGVLAGLAGLNDQVNQVRRLIGGPTEGAKR